MKNILSQHPLNQCEIQASGWDNVTEMVDTLIIYPFRKNKLIDQTFESYLKEKLFNSSSAIEKDDQFSN